MSVKSSVDSNADIAVAALIVQVGVRVQAVRKSQRLSRRELSERSGVSPRYLATLEDGQGNISLGILKKLALALNTPIDYFVTEDNSTVEECERFLTLYTQADPTIRSRVLQLLDPTERHRQKAQRLCLVGLRGAGKSTLGIRIADEFNAPFIELNTEITRKAGMPVAEIIALMGPDAYRKLEADVLRELIGSRRRLVVAVAGGIVSDNDTYKRVLSNFHTVWLRASPKEHMERVRAQGDLRPMQGNPEAMKQLRQILQARENAYAKADYELDTAGQSVESSQSELSELIHRHGLLG
jgi:XRE family aerobic/anaerobic benzoate catabolism transcriptional regulator